MEDRIREAVSKFGHVDVFINNIIGYGYIVLNSKQTRCGDDVVVESVNYYCQEEFHDALERANQILKELTNDQR